MPGSNKNRGSKQIAGRLESLCILTALRFSVVCLAVWHLGSIRLAISALKNFNAFRKGIHGGRALRKLAKVKGRYTISLYLPAWPSRAFFNSVRVELDRIIGGDPHLTHLQTIVFSVSSRCQLNCKHCFEWDNLGTGESLSLLELKDILNRLQNNGIDQVQISGGEPLNRFEDTLELVRHARKDSEFWLLTSGFGLNRQKATQLADAGFYGVNISLDHWDPEQHNAFRDHPESFKWVMEAAGHVRDAKMLLAVSLCVTREFVSIANLSRYTDLASKMGAGIIQFLEARPSGRFAGGDVDLLPEHIDLMDQFYLDLNSHQKNSGLPQIFYPGFIQRRMGCFGAGSRVAFMDSQGEFHACPFCRQALGNARDQSIPELINRAQGEGCQVFPMAPTFKSMQDSVQEG